MNIIFKSFGPQGGVYGGAPASIKKQYQRNDWFYEVGRTRSANCWNGRILWSVTNWLGWSTHGKFLVFSHWIHPWAFLLDQCLNANHSSTIVCIHKGIERLLFGVGHFQETSITLTFFHIHCDGVLPGAIKQLIGVREEGCYFENIKTPTCRTLCIFTKKNSLPCISFV